VQAEVLGSRQKPTVDSLQQPNLFAWTTPRPQVVKALPAGVRWSPLAFANRTWPLAVRRLSTCRSIKHAKQHTISTSTTSTAAATAIALPPLLCRWPPTIRALLYLSLVLLDAHGLDDAQRASLASLASASGLHTALERLCKRPLCGLRVWALRAQGNPATVR
jgi:hypothetical protein